MNQLYIYILEYLKEKNKVEVLGFGTFSLEDSNAKIINDKNNILPPAKEIQFIYNQDIIGNSFTEFIRQKENYSQETAQKFIHNSVSKWNDALSKKENLSIPNIGSFHFDNGSLNFIGERINDTFPDYFGLEEINITDLEKKATPKLEESSPDYSFNRFIFWTFLFFIPIAGLIGSGILYREHIFGKKSFEEFSVQKGTNRIPNNKPEESKNINNSPSIDSLKIDSTKISTSPEK